MSSASRRTILKPIALGSATPERPSGGPAALLSPGAASILMQPGSGPPKFHGHQLSAEGAASSGTEALQGVPMRLPHVDSHSHSREEVQHHQPGTANNRILDNMPIASSSEVARSPFRPSDAPPSHVSPVRRLSFKSSQTEGNAASTTADVNEARMQTTTAITVVPMAPATAQRVGAKGSYPQAAASAAVSLGKPLNTRDPIAPAPSHAHKPSRPHPGASKSLSRKNDTIVQPVQPGIQQPSAALRAVQAAQIDSSKPPSMCDVVAVASRMVTSSLNAGLRNAVMLVLGHPTYSPREQLAASEQVRRVALDLIHASISDAMSHVFAMLPAGPPSQHPC